MNKFLVFFNTLYSSFNSHRIFPLKILSNLHQKFLKEINSSQRKTNQYTKIYSNKKYNIWFARY